MDFSSLGNLISSLSTSGAQWYALVQAPPGTIAPPQIPALAPTSQSAVYNSVLGNSSSLLTIGIIGVAAYFIIKALK